MFKQLNKLKTENSLYRNIRVAFTFEENNSKQKVGVISKSVNHVKPNKQENYSIFTTKPQHQNGDKIKQGLIGNHGDSNNNSISNNNLSSIRYNDDNRIISPKSGNQLHPHINLNSKYNNSHLFGTKSTDNSQNRFKITNKTNSSELISIKENVINHLKREEKESYKFNIKLLNKQQEIISNLNPVYI